MQESTLRARTGEKNRRGWFLPREHGATAMLLIPFVCAALLARTWRWCELAAVGAAFAALAAKDPLVVLARQRFVWKNRRPETSAAALWAAGWISLVILSGMVLLLTWPTKAIAAMGLGVTLFSFLAVAVNLKNRQRSTLFQIASAAALTSTSLTTSLSATETVPRWCWWLWLLLTLQATAGILVVHARLDARIALRGSAPASSPFRRAAFIALAVLAIGSITAAILQRGWITLALFVALLGYANDLRAQRSSEALQLPLKKVGQRALALSSVYAFLLILGLW
jgi:hypothetical protein